MVHARFGDPPVTLELVLGAGLSDFQKQTVEGIAVRPDFQTFVTKRTTFEDDAFGGGPVTVTWYSTDGHLNQWRIGTKRILQQADTRPK